jgi:hypothetical protein
MVGAMTRAVAAVCTLDLRGGRRRGDLQYKALVQICAAGYTEMQRGIEIHILYILCKAFLRCLPVHSRCL